MKKLIFRVCVICGLLLVPVGTASADVQGRDLGLGLGLGDPSGVNLKKFVGGGNAFDVHVGFGSAWWGQRLRLHADYLWHFNLHSGNSQLDAYVGVGPKVGFYGVGSRNRGVSALTVGGRVPLGLAVIPGDIPIDIFFEVAPGIRFVTGRGPGFGGFVDGLLGVRYYFD